MQYKFIFIIVLYYKSILIIEEVTKKAIRNFCEIELDVQCDFE